MRHLVLILASSRSRALCLTEAFPFSLRARACSASSREKRSLAAVSALVASLDASARVTALAFSVASKRLQGMGDIKEPGKEKKA